MNDEALKEQLKRAAVDFAKVEEDYYKAKDKFDKAFDAVMGRRNGSQVEFQTDAEKRLLVPTRPLTEQVLSVLPADGRPMAIKQISAMIGVSPKITSATCSNLKIANKVESAGYGLWRRKAA